jgi:hypothetical protein
VRRANAAVAFALLLACAGAGAAQQDQDVPAVEVNGMKNPEMKSYRAVVAGLDAFDSHHRLAPRVEQLRFRMLTRQGAADSADDKLALRIASDEESFNVPVTVDGLFVVPRNESAYDHKADLIFNRKKGSYQVVPEIRTPGLPDNVRRLGDLRLDCKVRVAIAKEEIPLWATLMVNSILLGTDWCAKIKEKGGLSFPSQQALAKATLVEGERSMELGSSGHRYMVPVGDTSWSDEALVQLQYAQEKTGN